MANSNGSFGLRPMGKIGQSTNSTGMTEYRIASDNSIIFFFILILLLIFF